MTKINHYTRDALIEAVTTAGNMLINAEQCTVKAETLLGLALSEEDKFVLTKAAKIVAAGDVSFVYLKVTPTDLLPAGVTFADGTVQTLGLRFTNPLRMMLPSILTPPDYDAVLAQPGLRSWFTWRLRVGTALGCLNKMIEVAYQQATTLEQLRYQVPGILMLAKRHPNLEKYVERLQEFKAPASLPRLSPEQRLILADVSELLGIAALLDPGTPPAMIPEVTYSGGPYAQHPFMGRIRLV